eukprot:CAMPEP_0174751574 /NCGR_PEP_ID=MMETSP1094-20130205/100146_1 /TAXON_ID=156173 /ORGANISM="Chrysochromulina brevifilum, Strain UTEX LB 985" /LENGTH=30 /DNA_ID= /DNA_START= /DNA_END= /DNA_ORIENTATION=
MKVRKPPMPDRSKDRDSSTSTRASGALRAE